MYGEAVGEDVQKTKWKCSTILIYGMRSTAVLRLASGTEELGCPAALKEPTLLAPLLHGRVQCLYLAGIRLKTSETFLTLFASVIRLLSEFWKYAEIKSGSVLKRRPTSASSELS